MIHGHKKSDTKQKSQSETKQQNELTEKINTKLAEFFKLRNQPVLPTKIETLMQFTAVLMQLCSDITTIFNYRRELLQLALNGQDNATKGKLLGGDIKLITKIMQGDPKSYTLWSYRQWLVLKLFLIDENIIKKEKQLCSMLLTKDEKNFHVWNYRNWANSIKMNVDQQLQFTKAKINANPFNFSAYHFRSKYIEYKYRKNIQIFSKQQQQQILIYGMLKNVFDQQLQTVRTAIFLNPKQQAPWLYHSWLMKQLMPVLLLQIKPLKELTDKTPQNTHILHFSRPIYNPKDSFLINNLQFTVHSEKTPSANWQFTTDEPILSSNIVLKNEQFNLQNNGQRIVEANSQKLNQIVIIYQGQQNFVREVLESQENQCRFAYLQLSQIYRMKLGLGVQQPKVRDLCVNAIEVLSKLQGESKGYKYVEKVKKQWEILQNKSLHLDENQLITHL